MQPGLDFAALAAPGVRGLQPYVPGKPMAELEREFGVRDIVKLASNENPLGPPAESLAAVQSCLADLSLYPDGSAYELKRALARHLAVSPDQLTLGNGSNEVLSLLAETLLTPDVEAIHSEYAFVVYSLAIQATGAVARVAPANPPGAPQPLGHSLDSLLDLVRPRTRLLYIANPNNPTGTWLPPDEIRAFLARIPGNVIVVLDEAYREYMPLPERPDSVAWLREFPNLVICRTFSKIYGLAGARAGYAVSHPGLAELLNRTRQPFNLNSLAQAAALAALGATGHLARSVDLNTRGLEQLRTGLQAFGWTVPPSAGNFVLVDTGGPAGKWYEGLLRAGIIVRPLASYGLPQHLRITVGLPGQNERLLHALDTLRRGGGST